MANPPNPGQWVNEHPGQTIYDYAKLFPPQPGTALGASSSYDPSTVNFAPAQSSTPASVAALNHVTAPSTTPPVTSIPGAPTNSGPMAPGTGTGPGGTTPTGTTPSTSAINNVVDQAGPDPSALGGLGLGLSAIGGGAASQEASGPVDQQSGGILRGMAVRRPSSEGLVLGRKAY